MNKDSINITIHSGTVVKIVLVLLLMGALFYIRDILLIVLTAVVLASAIEPGTKWLVRRGLPRIISVVAIYLVLLSIVAAFFYFIIPRFLGDFSSLLNKLPHYISTVSVGGSASDSSSWQSALLGLSKSESLGEVVKNVTQSISHSSAGFLATLTSVFGGLLSFVLIFVISFYLAVQESGIEDFLRLVTPLKQEHYVISLWRRTQYKIGKWMQGQIILAFIVGILVYIGLSLLGVENAFFFALISAVFEIIPIFGPVVGSIPGVLFALLHGGLVFGVIVAIMYLIIQQIESHVIYPLVVKKLLNIHPLLVIIALVIGAKLGGLLGVLLSVPLAAALSELMSDHSKNRLIAREKMVEPV